ncbi:uncharacterized protein LOC133881098 [Alnus glutinosa]|uniref:uncharacterized protein LOC133881098 n=1 Tax=Alnus glutinosa TaxID=3517 RepID=UPI002D76BD4F|nr:uncharacterized protein LOC133881098 [Alnus glutinosa]
MDEADQEKTSFITDRGLYCYRMMSFGLKNTGATYQRLVNKMFRDQIGRNIEVYVDDMLRGIEANPEKVKAVLEMQPPRTTKQLQQLTERIAALNRFISRSTDKCLPFFKILRKAFIWTEECEEAFGKLKEYLMNLPLLSCLAEGEIIYLYLAVSPSAISSALAKGLLPSPCNTSIDQVSNEESIAEARPLDQRGRRHAYQTGWRKSQYAIKLDFVTTNNEAEYEAVLAGLSIAQEMRTRNLEVRSDSQVVVCHIQGQSEAQGEKMIRCLDKVHKYQSNFDRVALTKIPREDSAQADALSKMGSRTGPKIKTFANEVIVQTEPSIIPKQELMEIEEQSTDPKWATGVIQYLRNRSLPEDKMLSRKVKVHSARYTLIGGILYRRGHTEPLLKCLTNSEVKYVLKEIHEEVC